jgi:hypothetical protein
VAVGYSFNLWLKITALTYDCKIKALTYSCKVLMAVRYRCNLW